MKLPDSLPHRRELNDEVHARPPEPLRGPVGIVYLAMLTTPDQAPLELEHLAELCRQHGVPPPVAPMNHFVATLGSARLKWERHTEFSRYHIMVDTTDEAPFAFGDTADVPTEWIERLPGKLLVGSRIAMIRGNGPEIDADAISAQHFRGNMLIGSAVTGNKGVALTDFRLHADGMSRMLMIDRGMTPAQSGRIVQRMIEMDTYRMMALLTLPVARACGPFLARSGVELADITTRLSSTDGAGQAALLDRLMQLEGAIETQFASSQYRFTAAIAYYDLVRSRIEELREERIEGLQTFKEFMERRLAPAMSTCASVAQRLNALSARVARSTQLLSTRLALMREQQQQQVLQTMARRAKLQLRMQQTVEGLSVAAITYYVVGLIGYIAKAVYSLGYNINPEVVVGLSIPLVAVLVGFGVEAVRRRMGLKDKRDGEDAY